MAERVNAPQRRLTRRTFSGRNSSGITTLRYLAPGFHSVSGMRGISNRSVVAGIPAAAMHAPHQPQLRRVDVAAVRVQHCLVGDVHRHHAAEHQMAAAGQFDRLERLALEGDGAVGDAGAVRSWPRGVWRAGLR